MDGVAEMTLFQMAHHLDKDVTLAINSIHSTISDGIWMFFSERSSWYILYLAILIILYMRLGWKKGTIALLACILCIVCCDQFANLLKSGVQRLRPCWDEEMIRRGLHILEDKGGKYGFFSAHAANSMGFAACSILCLAMDKAHKHRFYNISMPIWALLVGISRVFVGKHFFGDVMFGWAVGALFGIILGVIATRVAKLMTRPS